MNEIDLITGNSERKVNKEPSGKSSKTELFKFYNINNNYNITLKDIKQDKIDNAENLSKRPNEIPVFNINSQNVITHEKSKSNSRPYKKKTESIKPSVQNLNYNNQQDQITNMDEYLNEMYKEDKINNEKKFKKLFTMKGKFSALAKEKCNN